MVFYVDSEYRCHVAEEEGLRMCEDAFFDGLAPDVVEGYRYIPSGVNWNGEAGKQIYPFVDSTELDRLQRQYELAELADARAALELLGVSK